MTDQRAVRESVWGYPRPPAVETASGRVVEVWFADRLIASTRSALRVLETSHPPVFHVPAADVAVDLLTPSGGASVCGWKGLACYWDLTVGERGAARAAWSYPDPLPGYRELRGTFAFHPGRVDRCTVDGETVRSQDGSFYGGWITDEISGPFKGAPGTSHW